MGKNRGTRINRLVRKYPYWVSVTGRIESEQKAIEALIGGVEA